ncbi:hypothetical protein AB6A23_19415 [Paenibacillus tarimensis]
MLLKAGLEAGAIGLSIGLLSAPGNYSAKEEIAELCSVLPKYDGLLSTQLRGEGNHLIDSIKEVIWIARKASVPLHVSHLKAAGKRNRGSVQEAMEVIADVRAHGLDVTCDVYPYATSSTMLTTVLPPWALEGGIGRRWRGLAIRSSEARSLKSSEKSRTIGIIWSVRRDGTMSSYPLFKPLRTGFLKADLWPRSPSGEASIRPNA